MVDYGASDELKVLLARQGLSGKGAATPKPSGMKSPASGTNALSGEVGRKREEEALAATARGSNRADLEMGFSGGRANTRPRLKLIMGGKR